MSLNQTPSPRLPIGAQMPHVHALNESCPTCEQPIPHDRFEEIQERIRTRQSEQVTQISGRLQEQFRREKADALERAALDAAETQASAVSIARVEERRSAEISHAQKLAELGRLNEERQAALLLQVGQADAARMAAEQVTRDALDNQASAIEAARAQERQAAEASNAAKLAEIERAIEERQAALLERANQADTARVAAEEFGAGLQQKLAETQADNAAAMDRLRQENEVNAARIQEEATRVAEGAAQSKLADMMRERQESETALMARVTESEAARDSVQATNATLSAQVEQLRLDKDAGIAAVMREAAAREVVIRQEAITAAESAVSERISVAQNAKADAEARASSAEEAARVLKETHEMQTEARVNEVRLAMEADKLQALNAASAARSEDNRRMSEQLADLQRRLDQKTAEELGEGAEVDLHEVLKARFEPEGDKIERVGKGKAGADIIHTVIHNGMVCGKIIYDSKNHAQWRYDFSEKLATDKIAEKADHAILSTRKFPGGMKQLDIQDGVILANPARVAVLAEVVRDHIVKAHALRMSTEEKALKSEELYAFITSSQFTDLVERIDAHAQELLDMRVKEQKAHEKMWKDQDILYRSIQKTGAELGNRVDLILGTAGKAGKTSNG